MVSKAYTSLSHPDGLLHYYDRSYLTSFWEVWLSLTVDHCRYTLRAIGSNSNGSDSDMAKMFEMTLHISPNAAISISQDHQSRKLIGGGCENWIDLFLTALLGLLILTLSCFPALEISSIDASICIA
jgi:hypothetical protein